MASPVRREFLHLVDLFGQEVDDGGVGLLSSFKLLHAVGEVSVASEYLGYRRNDTVALDEVERVVY